MAGPSYATVTQLGAGLGKLSGLSAAETLDKVARERQAQAQSALALDTTRLAQQRSGQLLEENELKLRRLRDLEAYRTGASVSGGGAAVANAPGGINYTGSVVSGTPAPTFDPAAVQAGANYTQSNYEAAAFGGTPPVEITPKVAPDNTGQPPPMRDAAKLVKDLEPVWANLEGRFGLPEGYLRRTAEIESSLDPNAQNPDSSAGGLFQFLDGTAAEFNLENRFDPVQASNAAAKLASRNARILAGVLGRQPTAGELYLAHQQGAGGASVLLDPANQDKKAVDVVSDPQFVLLNGGDENMSVVEFVKKWGKEKWAGSQYTFDQRQALNRGEGPDALKGNIYSNEKGLGLSINRSLNEFYPDRNPSTGKMDFSFPSPAIAKEAAVLYPSGEEVLAAAAETGARPGPRAKPLGLDGQPVVANTFTPENDDLFNRFPDLTKQYMGVRTVDGVTYSLEGREADGAPFYINQETGAYVDIYSLQRNPDQRQLFKKLRDAFTGAGTSMINSAGGVGADPERTLEDVEQLLTDAINSANSNPTGATLQRVKDLTAEKKELVFERQGFKGVFRGERNVASAEGPETGVTLKVQRANLKKLKENEANRLRIAAETEKAATAAFNAANSTLRQNAPTSPEGKKAINTAIKKLQAGLNTTGTGDADGTVKPQASVYSLDPAKLSTATQALEVAAATRATLVRQQALHRMAGNIDKEMQVELKIQELDANVISTNNYLKGMDVIRELKGGDLMPFVNLMANTFKTNDVELRETDGKWTLFVNGQENPTVKSMTQNDIAEYVGYLFDEDYKAATQAVSQSTVEFQQELLKKSHEAALKYTGEANNAASESARQAVIERIKNSGKFTQMGDSSRFQYTNEQGQIRIMDTEVLNPVDPDGLPSTVIYRIEGTGLVPVDN